MHADTRLDLQEIEAFAAVARCESFSKAAMHLGVSQSSISERLARLEKRLGQKLVLRTTRAVALTGEGHNLLVYADAIDGIAAQVRRHFEQPRRDGVLKLGIVEDCVMVDLIAVLALFRRHYPRFSITLRTALSETLFQALEDGDLDIVFAKQLPGRSRGRHVFTERLRWIGRPDAIGADAVVPLAIYPAPSVTRTAMLQALRQGGRTWTVAAECTSLAGLLASIVSGFAIGALSNRFLPDAVAALPRDLGLPDLPSLDYVIDQRPIPRDEAVDAFVSILAETIARARR